MLVKLDGDGNVAQYPYSEAQLGADHPDVSFPGDGYPELGVFPVANVDPGAPPEGKHFDLASQPVQQDDGTWAQAWVEQDN